MAATATIIDVRRTDLRTNVLENPYWITSGEIDKSHDDKSSLLFSFPITKSVAPGYKPFFIEQFVFEVTTGFAGGTLALTFGRCTLATDIITTGGTGTLVDVDEFLLYADITIATPAYYASTTGNTSAWLTAKIAGSWVAPYMITPTDTDVTAIYGVLTSDAAITAGAGRVHMLISEMPT